MVNFYVTAAIATTFASTYTITAAIAAIDNGAAAYSNFGDAKRGDPFAATADIVCFAVASSTAASHADVIPAIISPALRAVAADFISRSGFKESERIVAPTIAGTAGAVFHYRDRAISTARTT